MFLYRQPVFWAQQNILKYVAVELLLKSLFWAIWAEDLNTRWKNCLQTFSQSLETISVLGAYHFAHLYYPPLVNLSKVAILTVSPSLRWMSGQETTALCSTLGAQLSVSWRLKLILEGKFASREHSTERREWRSSPPYETPRLWFPLKERTSVQALT